MAKIALRSLSPWNRRQLGGGCDRRACGSYHQHESRKSCRGIPSGPVSGASAERLHALLSKHGGIPNPFQHWLFAATEIENPYTCGSFRNDPILEAAHPASKPLLQIDSCLNASRAVFARFKSRIRRFVADGRRILVFDEMHPWICFRGRFGDWSI